LDIIVKFKYLEKGTNQNYFHEKIKNRLNSEFYLLVGYARRKPDGRG
jgi:hypothetical protein